jgi:hypothetical protein
MEKDVPVLPRSQRRKMGIICIDIFFVSLVFFVCMLLVFKESFFFFFKCWGIEPRASCMSDTLQTPLVPLFFGGSEV